MGLISGLVVGLGVLVVVFLFALDDEDYKALLVWAVNNHSDYRLSIHGDFSFNPALVPSLSAHQVSLDSGPGDLRLRGPYFYPDARGHKPTLKRGRQFCCCLRGDESPLSLFTGVPNLTGSL